MLKKQSEEYRQLNKTISKEIRKDKRTYNRNKIVQVIEQNKSLKIFRKETDIGKQAIHKLQNKKGDVTSNRKEILNITENFYQQLYNNPDKWTVPAGIPVLINQGSEEIPEITSSEISAAMKEMKNNKSADEDGIAIETIKEGGTTILKVLRTLFNKCLEEGKTPSKWDNASIILLYKKGDITNLSNYRSISLLSHIYKLFTKILTKRLSNKMDQYQPREQAGFRSGFSTKVITCWW